jgi:hypothetical protein
LRSELLLKGFSTLITPFFWSGANSIVHRDRGAEALAKHLHEEHLLFPTSLQVVIAHSHGGNLALRALARLGDSIPSLPFLVTLATPFVSVVPVDIDPERAKRADEILDWGLFILLVVPPFIWLVLEKEHLHLPSWLVLIFVCALGGVGGALTRLLLAAIKATGELKIDRLVAATATSSICQQDSVRLLVLRSVDDEASLTLAAGAIGNRLARVMFLILTSLLRVCAFASFTAIPVLLFLMLDLFDFRHSPALGPLTSLYLILPMVLLSIPIMSLVLVGLAGLCRCVYGRELAVGELAVGRASCLINSHSVPDKIVGDLTVITLSESIEPRRLRHKIYDDQESVVVIAEWLDRQAVKLRTSI